MESNEKLTVALGLHTHVNVQTHMHTIHTLEEKETAFFRWGTGTNLLCPDPLLWPFLILSCIEANICNVIEGVGRIEYVSS